ncbi:MAG: DUF937 domain-containing protein [Hyphomicrobiales bacterium]
MNNLFEMMMQAQDGGAMDTLGKQFGLSQEQTEQALELMMPAFSNGLKRNTSDPMALMNFMSALSSGRHQQYHDDPASAFRDEAMGEGNAILGHLFGSKDTSRAVADQVALASGIGPSILKKMLPVVASMVMGGLFKGTQGRASQGGGMMDELLGSFMENMMGGNMGRMQQTQRRQQNPMGNNPFGNMLEDFLGGGMSAQPRASREQYRAPERGEDMFGEMFETGRKVQEDYRKNVDDIFSQYLDGMKRR